MLFDWQMGKWRCRPKKVYKFLWEIFVAAHKKKASKVVDDSRGNFLFIPERFFLFFRVKFWSIQRGRVEGVVDPGFCCIHHHYSFYQFLIFYYSIYSTRRRLLYFTFHWYFKILKREGSIFCLWVSSVAFLSILSKTRDKMFSSQICYTWRFVNLPSIKCTSLETLPVPRHLSFLDLAVSLW